MVYWIQKYENFVSRFPSVRIIWLDIPPYSISLWNKSRFHRNSEQFKTQDFVLQERIVFVNDYLKSINSRRGYSSIRFRADLLHYRKKSSKSSNRSSINFNLYKDGIHPGLILSKYWARRYAQRAIVDCS